MELQSNLTNESETTTNNLADIISWLKLNHYIIIHSGFGSFFHKCSKLNMKQ